MTDNLDIFYRFKIAVVENTNILNIISAEFDLYKNILDRDCLIDLLDNSGNTQIGDTVDVSKFSKSVD
jgi:hypothetical protein